MPTKKYTDFLESEPFTRDAKHGNGGTREYVGITCPHCTISFVQITKENIATSKATECLKHLRVCEAAKAAGLSPPPKKQTAPPLPDLQCVVCTDPDHAALAVRNDALEEKNGSLNDRLRSLERNEARRSVEIDEMRERARAKDREDDRRDQLLKLCLDKLGIPNPPLPTPEVLTDGFKKLERKTPAGPRFVPLSMAGESKVDRLQSENNRLRAERNKAVKQRDAQEELARDAGLARDALATLAKDPYAKKHLLAACHSDKLPEDMIRSAKRVRCLVDPEFQKKDA